ncbi:MAG: phosphoribosylamine--glycine ligase [Armatimonadetes bacterium]|nr:phosphoribosylamine--glycine ligase [Armatimonadota bacterium]
MKKVLIIGSGGREHALAWKLSMEAQVLWTPANAGGVADNIPTADILAEDSEGLVRLAQEFQPDVVVVGPEGPLIDGLADILREAGFAVVGPGSDGARLEGSKSFSKQMMVDAGIPTSFHATFTDAGDARHFAKLRFGAGVPVVVKADGAALGKGVVVCSTLQEAEEAIDMMLVDCEFGEAGKTIVIEDRVRGFEFSLLSLVNETGIWSFPVCQDYKRAMDGDRGPNTGGMGTYSPVAEVSDDLVLRTEEEIVRPLLRELAREKIQYRGVLFSGIMVEDGTPICLEYNVRFGDPETQTAMRRLGQGLVEALIATATGMNIPAVEIAENGAVTVVMAASGYPGHYEKGHAISIPNLPDEVRVFHAGTRVVDGKLESSGGRVLGVSAVGESVAAARTEAYQAISAIDAPGLTFRSDIAKL